MKKYLKVNTEKRVITIDKEVKPSKEDKELLQMYVNAGYTVRYKSKARAEKAKERAIKNGFGKKKS